MKPLPVEPRGSRVTRRWTMLSTINGKTTEKCSHELSPTPVTRIIDKSGEPMHKKQEKIQSALNFQISGHISSRTRKSIGSHQLKDPDKNNTPKSDLVRSERSNSGDVMIASPSDSGPAKEKIRRRSGRRSLRSSGQDIECTTCSSGTLDKGNQIKFGQGLTPTSSRPKLMNRELKNLADTNEFAKIDTVPVIYEIWRNGKLVTPERPEKKRKLEDNKASPVSLEATGKLNTEQSRKKKTWLNEGLYVGQKYGKFWTQYVPNGVLPLPMWHGKHILEIGRDFKLPFDVCSPLPPGQPKPDEWRKTTKNRFFGEAGALWKVSKFSDSAYSKCVCKPETGCGEDCQNRIMFYECDATNCALGTRHCTNRAFAGLQERRKVGGKYRIGVEVIKTADRGYGVRTNRCFEPHQIIVEYTGEIITEEECDRRMNEDYKDSKCYYLMSFDQSMIIDATKGSIARFVNHSCKPNCRMVKWIVSGNPRMALFAGDEPIMTGEELTYDYNFDPFSTKSIQECRCGSDNCRGILGPKPKDPKALKEVTKNTIKAPAKTGKRKFEHELDCDHSENIQNSKKRGVKDRMHGKGSSLPAVRDAVKFLKKTITNGSITPKKTVVKTYCTKSRQLNTCDD
ncbi:hypothetical protein K3495_g1192 [Podosphaera aphanis]|nr:hypothetical protein K3495_g1192 [Podosphaera aphanis]